MIETRIAHLKEAWDDREKRMGSTRRAVLFKRFPVWLNEWLHRRHMAFVLANIPPETGRLLDVGCGYGRISKEIKRQYPGIEFQGIDLCAGFAAAYEEEVGRCFNGPVQDFDTNERFDAIVIVTCLMYLDPEEHVPILKRLWTCLNPGGSLVCIEPATEVLTLWRRRRREALATPTGDTVHFFERGELKELCCGLHGAHPQASTSISLVPLLRPMTLHWGVAVRKDAESMGRLH